MSTSPNLNLQLTDADDGSVKFQDWRLGLDGPQAGSNMMKLDKAAGDLKEQAESALAEAEAASAKAADAQTAAASAQETADGAQQTADSKAAVKAYTFQVTTSGWSTASPYTKSVAVTGLTAAMTPIADITTISTTAATARKQLEAWDCVDRLVTGTNTITLYCYNEKPTTAFYVQLKVVE